MKYRKRGLDSRKNIVFNIQSIILSVLMAISLVTIIVMGLLLYHRFKLALEKTAVDNTEATVEATVDRLNADLLDIRQILNGANYNVVQQFDISSREFSEQFNLLYETNSDKIQSVALYDQKGNLIASEPVAAEKKNVRVQTQEWFKKMCIRDRAVTVRTSADFLYSMLDTILLTLHKNNPTTANRNKRPISTSPIKCPVFLDLFSIHNPPLSLHDPALIFVVHRYI